MARPCAACTAASATSPGGCSIACATPSAGHVWFEQYLPELASRTRAYVRRLPPAQHEEAVAEILAQLFAYTVRAADRGKLHLLTPFTLVSFFGRAYYQGRRLGGSSTTDVLSEQTRYRRGLRVVSLDRFPLGRSRLPLSLVLARRPRAGLIAAGTAALCLAPWLLWAASHRAGVDPALVAGYGTYTYLVRQAGWQRPFRGRGPGQSQPPYRVPN